MKPFSEYTTSQKILIVIGGLSLFFGALALLSETEHVRWFMSLSILMHTISVVSFPFAFIGIIGLIIRWVYLLQKARITAAVFVRSRSDLRLGGLCGGIASYIQVSSVLVRLVALFVFLVNPVMFLVVYALLVIAVPQSSH